jgi:hypothetical protein
MITCWGWRFHSNSETGNSSSASFKCPSEYRLIDLLEQAAPTPIAFLEGSLIEFLQQFPDGGIQLAQRSPAPPGFPQTVFK